VRRSRLPTRAIRGSLCVPCCEDDVSRPLTNRCSVQCCAVLCGAVLLGAALVSQSYFEARWRAESTSLEGSANDGIIIPGSRFSTNFSRPLIRTAEISNVGCLHDRYCVPESQQRHRRTRTNCFVCLRRPCSIQCRRQSDVRIRIQY